MTGLGGAAAAGAAGAGAGGFGFGFGFGASAKGGTGFGSGGFFGPGFFDLVSFLVGAVFFFFAAGLRFALDRLALFFVFSAAFLAFFFDFDFFAFFLRAAMIVLLTVYRDPSRPRTGGKSSIDAVSADIGDVCLRSRRRNRFINRPLGAARAAGNRHQAKPGCEPRYQA